MKIAELKNILNQNPTQEFIENLKSDKRISAQKLLKKYYLDLEKEKKAKMDFKNLLKYEDKYWEKNFKYIIGIDEAGRGPLAGPLVVAGVILPNDIYIAGLNDSKKLSEKKRESLYTEICKKAISIVVHIVSVADIDKYNIYHATLKSMTTIIKKTPHQIDIALIDAMPVKINNLPIIPIIKGDSKSANIAAASIIAKVTRDRMMIEIAKDYPEYDFDSNKGYGSRKHMDVINEIGFTKWHRRSFEPVKTLSENEKNKMVDQDTKLIILK